MKRRISKVPYCDLEDIILNEPKENWEKLIRPSVISVNMDGCTRIKSIIPDTKTMEIITLPIMLNEINSIGPFEIGNIIKDITKIGGYYIIINYPYLDKRYTGKVELVDLECSQNGYSIEGITKDGKMRWIDQFSSETMINQNFMKVNEELIEGEYLWYLKKLSIDKSIVLKESYPYLESILEVYPDIDLSFHSTKDRDKLESIFEKV